MFNVFIPKILGYFFKISSNNIKNQLTEVKLIPFSMLLYSLFVIIRNMIHMSREEKFPHPPLKTNFYHTSAQLFIQTLPNYINAY